MSLFKCSSCGVVENTAPSRFWMHRAADRPPLCTQCDPEIGKWHGLFPRELADVGYVDDGTGFLISKDEDAMRRSRDAQLKDWKELADRIGVERAMRCAFEAGFWHGVDRARGSTDRALLAVRRVEANARKDKKRGFKRVSNPRSRKAKR